VLTIEFKKFGGVYGNTHSGTSTVYGFKLYLKSVFTLALTFKGA